MKRMIAAISLFSMSLAFADESPPKPPTVLEKIAKAKEALQSQTPNPIYSKQKGKNVLIGKEPLRATEMFDGTFRVVRIKLLFVKRGKKGDTAVQSVSPESCAAERVSGGGVNTNYRILCDGKEEAVFAGKDLDSGGKEIKNPAGETECYVPYSDALALPEVIEAGKSHLKEQISLAAAELRAQKVYSRGIPGKLVADIFPERMLYTLALIEHIDHDEYRDKGPEYSEKKALTQIGLNGPEAFFYSKSKIRGTTVGALCLMQIVPSTYKGVRAGYRGAKLPASAQEGSCGSHVSAIKTAYLVLDSKLSAMQPEFKRLFEKDSDTYGVYLAVAYNGGEGRARNLFEKTRNPAFKLKEVIDGLFRTLGIKKERKKLAVLKQETWIYIKKYFELSNMPE